MAIEASNRFSGLSLPVAPHLLLEFHGSASGVEEQAKEVGEIVADFGAIDYRFATDAKERAELWKARHDSFYASLSLRPGSRAITTDVCVPISRLAECITETRRDLDASALVATMVGHVGDGNFHVVILVDPDDAGEVGVAESLTDRLVERALAMDGTCTGEHGIGLRKLDFLERELPGGVEVMRTIKGALDPHNLMNPGKVLKE
jgi:D-lactate dehydrogenase (cytochrome)